MPKETDPMELVDIYLEEIVIPALTEISGVDYTEVARWLPRRTAAYMRYRQGASNAMVGRHMGRSSRWVSQVTNDSAPEEGTEPGWLAAINNILLDAFPKSVTANRMHRRLLQEKGPISLISVKKHLKLYHSWDLFEQVGEDEYRDAGKTRVINAEVGAENSEKLRDRIGVLPKICQSYVRGEAGSACGMMQGVMDAACWGEFNEEMPKVIEALMNRYQRESLEKEKAGQANLQHFSGLVLLGPCKGPARPKKKGKRNDTPQ